MIGLEPEGQRVYETADGHEVVPDFALARIEILGDVTTRCVNIGDKVDLVNQRPPLHVPT